MSVTTVSLTLNLFPYKDDTLSSVDDTSRDMVSKCSIRVRSSPTLRLPEVRRDLLPIIFWNKTILMSVKRLIGCNYKTIHTWVSLLRTGDINAILVRKGLSSELRSWRIFPYTVRIKFWKQKSIIWGRRSLTFLPWSASMNLWNHQLLEVMLFYSQFGYSIKSDRLR